MGALRQPRPIEPERKQPKTETRDKYGRDPNSLPEKLRARTDYATGEGWAPFPHAVLADLPRLSSGTICTTFVLVCNMLSLGRPRKSGQPWHSSTEPISKADLAELCFCDEKGIQRQISELTERGMISVKTHKSGVMKYVISLLYSTWRELEDYAVWKRKQVVSIDEGLDDDAAEDESPAAVSSEAVHVFKAPVVCRPGRASKQKKLPTSVNAFVFQNDSTIDASCTAVIQSGCLIVSASVKTGEREEKGERKANAVGHGCPAAPTKGGTKNPPTKAATHPRAEEICKLFDPLLQRSGSRLLSPDSAALEIACTELGAVPHDFLVHFVMGPGGRAGRPISSPRAVCSILKECRANWDKRLRAAAPKMSADDMRADELARARSVLADADSSLIDLEWARGVLADAD